MPTIQISALFKTQEANESECFEKNCSESSHENACSGIYFFFQITKVEYVISAKMYSEVHVNYLV